MKPGKFLNGKTNLFCIYFTLLYVKGNKVLYETYYQTFSIHCAVTWGSLCWPRTWQRPVNLPSTLLLRRGSWLQVLWTSHIIPATLQNIKERALLSRFLIREHLNSMNCVIVQLLTGELVVERPGAAAGAGGDLWVCKKLCPWCHRDSVYSDGHGDICRGLSVPIYMIFSRLFTALCGRPTSKWNVRPPLTCIFMLTTWTSHCSSAGFSPGGGKLRKQEWPCGYPTGYLLWGNKSQQYILVFVIILYQKWNGLLKLQLFFFLISSRHLLPTGTFNQIFLWNSTEFLNAICKIISQKTFPMTSPCLYQKCTENLLRQLLELCWKVRSWGQKETSLWLTNNESSWALPTAKGLWPGGIAYEVCRYPPRKNAKWRPLEMCSFFFFFLTTPFL